jgi:hypothetical protein
MQRFEQTLLLDALAKTGRLSAPLISELAGHIADFHVMAERSLDYGGAAALAAVIETNHRCLAQALNAGFDPERIDEIHEKSLQRLGAVGALLDRRVQQERYGAATATCTCAMSACSRVSRHCLTASNSPTSSPRSTSLRPRLFVDGSRAPRVRRFFQSGVEPLSRSD